MALRGRNVQCGQVSTLHGGHKTEEKKILRVWRTTPAAVAPGACKWGILSGHVEVRQLTVVRACVCGWVLHFLQDLRDLVLDVLVGCAKGAMGS